MRAIWLEQGSPSVVTNLPTPTPEADEVLVRVRLAGVCATDLELIQGYYPFRGVLGHEFVGQVVTAPSQPDWEGQRVVGEINIACGVCEPCRTGSPSHCEQRTVLGIRDRNGAFAEYLLLPVRNLHMVPPGIPDVAAVFTEPLAAALEIQSQVHIQPGWRVLVVGAGRLGQLVAQSLVVTGCELKVVARHATQRRLLAERGITWISEEQVPAWKMDLVVDATGSAGGFDLARRAVRPRGTLVLKSTYKGDLTFNASALVVDEITLLGSRCGPFSPALSMLEHGWVDPLPLIEAVYSLDEGVQALARAAEPGALKILIQP